MSSIYFPMIPFLPYPLVLSFIDFWVTQRVFHIVSKEDLFHFCPLLLIMVSDQVFSYTTSFPHVEEWESTNMSILAVNSINAPALDAMASPFWRACFYTLLCFNSLSDIWSTYNQLHVFKSTPSEGAEGTGKAKREGNYWEWSIVTHMYEDDIIKSITLYANLKL